MIDPSESLTLDVRNLPPPQPMIRILEAVATLHPGTKLVIKNSRVPHLLYPRLKERGLEVTTEEQPNGEVILTILRP